MDLIYIPHRDENAEKIERVRALLDIHIRRIDLPVELYLLNQIKKPSVISGFITSALPNCKEIFGDELEIVAIRISGDKVISKTMLSMIENTYTYFQKIADENFKVLTLH